MGKEKVLLIDGDSLLYAASCATNKFVVVVGNDQYFVTGDEERAKQVAHKAGKDTEVVPFYPPISHAITRVKTALDTVLKACNATQHKLYISGSQDRNIKKQLYPLYKGNRTAERPLHYSKIKKYLIEYQGAVEVHQEETDDYVTREEDNLRLTYDVVVATKDKDLLYMVPGHRYDFHHHRFIHTSEAAAAMNYGMYILSGDASDGIPGLHGFGEVKHDENGRIVESGRTYKTFTDKMKELNLEENCLELSEAIKVSWHIWKEQLKSLPINELKKRFETTCNLLWLPSRGFETLVDYLGGPSGFEGKVYSDATK